MVTLQVPEWGICGHGPAAAFLHQTIAREQVHHAYLITGIEHVGKQTLALAFARALMCPIGSAGSACGNCQTCRSIGRGAHPDVVALARGVDEKTGQPQRDIKIDAIRELKSRFSQYSLLGGWKVAIIDGAEHLNQGAANALLKLLEEPTPRTVLILLARNHSQILPTLVSRCQTINLQPVPAVDIRFWLIAGGADPDLAQQAAAWSYGAPGLARAWVEEPERRARYEQLRDQCLDLFTVPVGERLSRAGDILPRQNRPGAVALAQSLVETLECWERVMRDLLVLQSDVHATAKDSVVAHRWSALAPHASVERLTAALRRISEIRLARYWSPSYNIFEQFLIHI